MDLFVHWHNIHITMVNAHLYIASHSDKVQGNLELEMDIGVVWVEGGRVRMGWGVNVNVSTNRQCITCDL